MNEHTFSGVNCRFILRPYILGIRTDQQGFMPMNGVITLLPLHTNLSSQEQLGMEDCVCVRAHVRVRERERMEKDG